MTDKIIQISTYGTGNETVAGFEEIFGLSKTGRLYRLAWISKIGKKGWQLIAESPDLLNNYKEVL